jgi:hypothetical protein
MANVIKIKSSGSANSVPSALQHGELALNYADGRLFYKNASNTIVNIGTVKISDNAPSSPSAGELWYESDTGKLFTYYDSYWVEIGGAPGPEGPAGIVISNTSPESTDVLWADTSEVGTAVLPIGGTTGQVLAKNSGANYDTEWVEPSDGISISALLLIGA